MSYNFFSWVYDELTANVDYNRILNFILPYFKPDDIVLDLACGTGNISVPLAENGISVIGCDVSVDMLGKAQQKSAECGTDIIFMCQDMQQLDLYGTIQGAVCTLDSLNHLDSIKSAEKTFERVSLFMDKGGYFIFDLNTEYKHKEILSNKAYLYDCENVFCAWQNSYNIIDCSVDIELTFFEKQSDDKYIRFTESFSEIFISDYLIHTWCEQYGFSLCGMYDDYQDKAPTDTTERITYVLQKNRQDNRG